MNIGEIINIMITVLEKYLFNKKFTGKIVLIFHCKEGSVGKCTSEILDKKLCTPAKK